MLREITRILNSLHSIANLLIVRDKIARIVDSLTEIYEMCEH